MVPYGVSDDIVKIMTEDELKRAQLLWLAEPLNVAWNMHEIFAEGIDEVLSFSPATDGIEDGPHPMRAENAALL